MKRTMLIRSLLIVVSVLLCVSAASYVINVRQQAALSQTLEQLNMQNRVSALNVIRLRRQLQDMKDKPVMSQTIPAEPDEPGILDGLQRLAAQTGVKVQSVSFALPGMPGLPGSGAPNNNGAFANSNNMPSPPNSQTHTAGPPGNAVAVSITLKGTDEQLIQFVKNVENGPRKAVLMNVDYTIGTDMLVDGLVLQISYPYQQG
jgi:Tfp pilus assembly protein PilO